MVFAILSGNLFRPRREEDAPETCATSPESLVLCDLSCQVPPVQAQASRATASVSSSFFIFTIPGQRSCGNHGSQRLPAAPEKIMLFRPAALEIRWPRTHVETRLCLPAGLHGQYVQIQFAPRPPTARESEALGLALVCLSLAKTSLGSLEPILQPVHADQGLRCGACWTSAGLPFLDDLLTMVEQCLIVTWLGRLESSSALGRPRSCMRLLKIVLVSKYSADLLVDPWPHANKTCGVDRSWK